MKFRTAGSAIDLDPEWIKRTTLLLRSQPVGLYARISGQKSLEGSSLDSQIAVNRRFALECGATIRAEKTEVITGIFITSRSEFNALLQLAEKGEIKFIIVDVRDRLGRGDAISVLEFLTRQTGAQIIYATQPADPDTYEGAALDATETLVSRIERLNIRRRLNRGRREWASEGRIFTGRFFPFGYRIKISRDDKGRLLERTLIIHEPEALIVKRIFRWFVFDDLTTYAIAVRLYHQGVHVPESRPDPLNKSTDQWYASTVERILKNETYAGVWHYGKVEIKRYEAGTTVRSIRKGHPPEHRIAIPVPAIIERDLWEAAQIVLKKHAHGGRPPNNHYLLSGIVRCTKSKANLHGHTAKHKASSYGYYVCPHRTPLLRLNPATRCDVQRLHQGQVEYWVWNSIMKLAAEPERIEVELHFRSARSQADQHLVHQVLTGIERETDRLKRQKVELLDLYLNRDSVGSGLTREEYETKAQQINAQINESETHATEMQTHLKAETFTPQEADEALRLLKAVHLAGPLATFEEKRTLLRLLAVQVLYDGETLQLIGSIPTSSIRLDELLRKSNPGETSSPQLQSEPLDGSPVEAEGSSIFEDRKRNKGCTRD